jgi:hypothetical protein
LAVFGWDALRGTELDAFASRQQATESKSESSISVDGGCGGGCGGGD